MLHMRVHCAAAADCLLPLAPLALLLGRLALAELMAVGAARGVWLLRAS